jgi:PAS domain S-box-containing protein
MGSPLRILIVEDVESDAALIVRNLEKGGYDVRSRRVDTEASMDEALKLKEWDAVISDYQMPGFDAEQSLAVLKKTGLDIPFIVVSGTIGEDTAVAIMKAGANDYLMKDNLTRLVPAVERELREAQIRRERRHADKALRESRERLGFALQAARMGVWSWEIREERRIFDEQTCRLLGIDMKRFTGRAEDFFDVVHPDDRPILKAALTAALSGSAEYEPEYRVVWPNGEIRHITARGKVLRDSDNRPVRLSGIIWDVTDRARAEENLRKLSTRHETLLAAVPEIVMEVDMRKVYTWANEAGIDFFGPDVIGREADYYFAGAQPTYEQVTPVFEGTAGTIYVENYQNRRDGQVRLLAWWCRSLRDAAGVIIGALSSARDITEIRRVETALRESEERYRLLFSSAKDGLVLAEADTGVIVDCNDGLCAMIERDWSEIVGRLQAVLHPPEDLVDGKTPDFARNAVEDGPIVIEKHILSSSGRMTPVEIQGSRIRMRGKNYILGIFRDITERKKFEAGMIASLHEKEILLKEIHHRVKNNLQIIVSLMNLQAASIEDERILESFAEIRNRIYSMALLHEKLYQSTDFSEIHFGEYIVSLCRELVSTLAAADRFTLDFRTEDITLDIDRAVPCGLILNELVTNSIKHAFPRGGGGTIRVSFVRKDRTSCELTVEDDGRGLAPNRKRQGPESLGMKIVRILTDQIDGTLDVRSGPGASFRIVFPASTTYSRRVPPPRPKKGA